ncbi:hypothetical protein B5X24_HaOG209144 [Helicoverpa armigera]|nr:hypothetical protein B5X24_HaOG209144 [Helicoverpa armigera]
MHPGLRVMASLVGDDSDFIEPPSFGQGYSPCVLNIKTDICRTSSSVDTTRLFSRLHWNVLIGRKHSTAIVGNVCWRRRVAGDGAGAAAERGHEMSVAGAPPPSAAEALSALLWQPYECRSPPLARSRTDTALHRAGGDQSPTGGRHARASTRAYTDMRLPVPAPGLRKSDSVSVRVPGEPSRPNVSSVNVNIVEVQDAPVNVNSAVQTERERSVASAECQTEEPARRRRRAGMALHVASIPRFLTSLNVELTNKYLHLERCWRSANILMARASRQSRQKIIGIGN